MTLKQTLEPNEKGVSVYANGVFQGYENITILSDEQLAEEAEQKALAKADQLIDAITNLAQAKVFLKRLCARLIRNNVLP